jgi:hypothetical protein
MTYSQFEDELLVALVTAADAAPRGQVEVMEVARTVSPDASKQWIRSAVQKFEDYGWADNVSRAMPPPNDIILTITGDGRRRAEELD